MELFDLRQLKIFSTLAEVGSFTVAADQLFLTQSAVSHSLKSLERQLDCQLVERLGKSISLTLAGERLLQHSRAILHQANAAFEDVTSLLRPGFGRLRVGAAQTACYYILPGVIREFRECFPNCEISITPGDTTELVNLVESGQIDIAVSLRSAKTDHLNFRPLFQDELACVYSPLSVPSGNGEISPEDLHGEKLIIYAHRSLTTRLIKEYFRKSSVPLPQLIELGNMESIKEFAKIGVGVGIVASWIAHKELIDQSLQLRRLSGGALKREWGVYSRNNRSLTIMEENFVGLCEIVCRELLKREKDQR